MTWVEKPIRERIRNRVLVREQVPIRGKEVAGFLALMVLIAVPLVFGLRQNNEYVRTSFEIATLRRERQTLEQRYRRLRIEKATLESLTRIQNEARRQGLVPPEETSNFVLIPSGVPPARERFVRAGSAAGAGPRAAGPSAAHAETPRVSVVPARVPIALAGIVLAPLPDLRQLGPTLAREPKDRHER